MKHFGMIAPAAVAFNVFEIVYRNVIRDVISISNLVTLILQRILASRGSSFCDYILICFLSILA